MLDSVLVRLDIAATERGSTSRDPNGVKHAIAVEEMIGPTGNELWVRAIADVRAIKALR